MSELKINDKNKSAPAARLIEIFSSFQGEGPYLGLPMTFVRFQDCDLSCQYCDTPDSFRKLAEFRLESPPLTGEFDLRPNPIEALALSELLSSFSTTRVALTGGEPLQQADFLAHWLPQLKQIFAGRRQDSPQKISQDPYWILLETNGVLPEALKKVLPYLDVISMDVKLSSTTGMKAYWKEHEAFLKVATEMQASQEIYVKLVIGTKTSQEEIQQAFSLVKKYHPKAQVVLQPVTPRNKEDKTLSITKLSELFEQAQKILPQVRVIPQLHPCLGIL